MKLRWFAVTALAAGLGLGCAHGSQSSPPQPGPVGLDTFRAGLAERDSLERTYLLTSYLRTLDMEGPVSSRTMAREPQNDAKRR